MEVSNHARKRKAIDAGPNSPPSYRASDGYEPTNAVDLSLLEELEKSSHHQVEAVDLKTLKKLVLSFERRLRDNIAARLKYVENPEKFADSEVDLHDELQKLKILAGAPELYPELVASNTVPSIVNLLSHENADIANDVVQLLQDLTDEDALEDNDEPARVLVDALVENNVLELLVQNMNRLSEGDPDEAAAIYATLTVIENLVEVKPAVAEMVCERTKLLRWLVLKIKVRDFEGIKQYASEILAILLQNSTANQKRLGQMNGVDAVLEGVAMYKSKDPKTPDEEEMLENLFDVLCCLLMPLENKERFVNAEGVELMIIIMKQKKYAYGSAIRALDFAMTNYPPACERFVDVMGLKTAFAAFMGKASLSLSIPIFAISLVIPLNKRIKRERYKEELEERVISLVASLFAGILRGSRRDRLLSKFVENEYEKIDRLMELYIRYSDRVRSEAERLDQLELDDLELDEDEKYNRKLESGLYSLQLVAVILGHIWCSEHSGMRARIELLLKQQKLSKDDVKEILQEYHDNLGDVEGAEEKERGQARIQLFISAM
ncbi:BnaAnng12660D [Brassica napus]|uniref:BnaAnng12660D protein n=1 Tax=Brassica napus TaxID=3708 RepID=A0A078IXJ0_BRANA|nr:BnaAnng12660D [Brassica napus]